MKHLNKLYGNMQNFKALQVMIRVCVCTHIYLTIGFKKLTLWSTESISCKLVGRGERVFSGKQISSIFRVEIVPGYIAWNEMSADGLIQ
jgi:hypothetical protein